jgi:hypothetical protein
MENILPFDMGDEGKWNTVYAYVYAFPYQGTMFCDFLRELKHPLCVKLKLVQGRYLDGGRWNRKCSFHEGVALQKGDEGDKRENIRRCLEEKTRQYPCFARALDRYGGIVYDKDKDYEDVLNEIISKRNSTFSQ